ncbi:MAG: nucleoside monophosphate kinase [Candidatus Nomurabacteria bacterium]|nr:nucleoside monophosphate kinase [Candidatus Nomurabacteria bacterium]
MQTQTFVFFGIVGSGKGTQVKLLMDVLKAKDGKDCVYISPGNEYRKIITSDTQTASLVKVTLDKGGLLPDFLTNAVFLNIVIPSISIDKHLIADGFPRSLDQSNCFEETMNFYDRKNIKVIYIELSKEEAIKRMKIRARHDDTDEGIAKRFDEYEKNVIPAMNYFKNKEGYTIFNINGEQTIENVQKDINKALGL